MPTGDYAKTIKSGVPFVQQKRGKWYAIKPDDTRGATIGQFKTIPEAAAAVQKYRDEQAERHYREVLAPLFWFTGNL